MKRAIDALTERRDDQGRLVIGRNARDCPHCGAPPKRNVSECGRLVWIRPDLNCCAARRAGTPIKRAPTPEVHPAAKHDRKPKPEPEPEDPTQHPNYRHPYADE